MSDIYLNERPCVQCGKLIYPHNVEKWAYKVTYQKVNYCFCSYGCMQAYKKRWNGKGKPKFTKGVTA